MRVTGWMEADGLTVKREQPERGLILDTLQRMRNLEPMADLPGIGRWALSIPAEDWLTIREQYPELQSKDGQERSRAWARFIASDESIPYRVRDKA